MKAISTEKDAAAFSISLMKTLELFIGAGEQEGGFAASDGPMEFCSGESVDSHGTYLKKSTSDHCLAGNRTK